MHAPLSEKLEHIPALGPRIVHGVDQGHGIVPVHERCARQSLWREDPMR
jgi:hypothetical protein